MIPPPTGVVALPDGRRLAYDDVGDPLGAPVVYLHGCPDCRLTRPPDDAVAAGVGARVIAVDRPGYGSSDPDPHGDDNALAADVIVLADELGVDRFAVLGWSSGGPSALAAAALHPDRVAVAGVATGQVPIDADSDPEVRASLDPLLATRADAMGGMTADAFAAAVAPFVATSGMTEELAREHILEGKSSEYRRDLAAVQGLLDQLALAMVAAVEQGLAGVERDMRCMVSPWPFELSAIEVPVVLWYGQNDTMFGPAAGRWLADRIPGASLEVVEASHLLPLVRWASLLTVLVSYVRREVGREVGQEVDRKVDRKEANATQP